MNMHRELAFACVLGGEVIPLRRNTRGSGSEDRESAIGRRRSDAAIDVVEADDVILAENLAELGLQ